MIHIRRMQGTDVSAVLEMVACDRAFSPDTVGDPIGLYSEFELNEWIASPDVLPTYVLPLVATVFSRVCGFAIVLRKSTQWCEIEALYVSKDFRRCDIGKQLLAVILDEARVTGADYVNAIVDENDSGVTQVWLERMGFTKGKQYRWFAMSLENKE